MPVIKMRTKAALLPLHFWRPGENVGKALLFATQGPA
jgi:hypothetical protein